MKNFNRGNLEKNLRTIHFKFIFKGNKGYSLLVKGNFLFSLLEMFVKYLYLKIKKKERKIRDIRI